MKSPKKGWAYSPERTASVSIKIRSYTAPPLSEAIFFINISMLDARGNIIQFTIFQHQFFRVHLYTTRFKNGTASNKPMIIREKRLHLHSSDGLETSRGLSRKMCRHTIIGAGVIH
jgi:hypothetical protein